MNIVYKTTSELIPYARNPRKNAPAVEAVAASIKEFGFKQPIVIDDENVIVCGHTRALAAHKLGMELVPCLIAEDLTAAQVQAYRVLDNKIAELAEWDSDLLKIELEELSINPGDFGIDFTDDLLDLTPDEPNTEEDETPEPPKEAFSQLGDLWLCGNHRVLCGDSKNGASILPRTPDAIFTDPPYGVSYESRMEKNKGRWGPIANDSLESKELGELLDGVLGDIEAEFRFVCCSWDSYSTFEGCLGRPNSLIIWDKGHFGLGRGYRRQHEFIMFYGTMNRTDLSDVWQVNRATNYQHPTQKPIELVAKALTDVRAEDVYDPFMGSGTTLIAAERCGSTCYGVELEPKYIDVILQRYYNETGIIPVRESDGMEFPVEIKGE